MKSNTAGDVTIEKTDQLIIFFKLNIAINIYIYLDLL